jgi:hypothetical protein
VEEELGAGPEEAREAGPTDDLPERLPAGQAADVAEEQSIAPHGLTGEQLDRLREVLVAANADAVPELIAGADFEALLASVEPARAAFARVKEVAAQGLAAGVPRGGGTREIDPAVYGGLSPEGKIAVGLTRRG